MTSNKYEKYLLLKRFNESEGHFFVIQDIKNFLEKKGVKVELFATKKPDLVFNIKDKTYAIEVETGTCIADKRKFAEKLKVLKNYKNWFFVVTAKKHIQKYREFGRVIDPRFLRSYLIKLLKS